MFWKEVKRVGRGERVKQVRKRDEDGRILKEKIGVCEGRKGTF